MSISSLTTSTLTLDEFATPIVCVTRLVGALKIFKHEITFEKEKSNCLCAKFYE